MLKICAYCKNKFEKLERHHIIPRCYGGQNCQSNIVKICHSCHVNWHRQNPPIKSKINSMKPKKPAATYVEYNFAIIGKKSMFVRNDGSKIILSLCNFGEQKGVESFTQKHLPIHADAAQQIKEYLGGKRKKFHLGIKTKHLHGTKFQRAIWQQMLAIPYGETRSYKWIAEKLGHPTASRAVANACGKNPLPIIIPCHRVIRSNGELGGFSMSGGVEIKKKLLALEGVVL
jgi:methylated-DNA-[protein]-cysteine S-methyltransferase